MSSHAIASTSLEILANLENLLDMRSSEPWSYRRLPTPTATFPAIINSEEEDSENEFQRTRDYHISTSKNEISPRLDSFLKPKDDLNQDMCKQIRALRKKLQQIEMLEAKQSSGHLLDDQQIAKLQTRSALESSLAELGVPVITEQVNASSSVSPEGKGSKKARKQRKKSKQRPAEMEIASGVSGTELGSEPAKNFMNIDMSQVLKHKVGFSLITLLFDSSMSN